MSRSLNFLFLSILNYLPHIIILFLVFTGTDFSFVFSGMNFSFNIVYLVIFYWVLKKPDVIGFGFIFLAGIINDVVLNLPIGLSAFIYLLMCGIASFIRTITLVPNILYDWVFFFIGLLIISSIYYIILTLIFNSDILYGILMLQAFLTALVYPLIAKLFDGLFKVIVGKENAE